MTEAVTDNVKETLIRFQIQMEEICKELGVSDIAEISRSYAKMKKDFESLEKSNKDLLVDFENKDKMISELTENNNKILFNSEFKNSISKYPFKKGLENYLKTDLEKKLVIENNEVFLNTEKFDDKGVGVKMKMSEYIEKLLSDVDGNERDIFLEKESTPRQVFNKEIVMHDTADNTSGETEFNW